MNDAKQQEPLLTISDVCRRIPAARGGRRLAPSTVTRWILSGCPNRAGVRVRLRAVRVGGRWMIRPDELDGFFEALGADPAIPPPPVPPTANQRRAAEAGERLARRGY